MKKRTIGILAHVDAGKTTLGEAILYACGKLKKMGRVDRGDTALDTHDLERRRGITIFSAQAQFSHAGVDFTLLDTPGHVDFAAEMERTLHVLDCAVLVISGSDGVQAHTETLWRLLRRYGVPVFLFVTKMDMPGTDRAALLAGLRGGLSERILDFTVRPADEELAMCSEALLERYLDRGGVTDADITELIAARELFPCFFGSGLREEGVTEFLDGLARWAPAEGYGEDFAARVFKITRGARDERLTHVKLTGGALSVRDAVRYAAQDGTAAEEKVTGIRFYTGARFETRERAGAGDVCALAGLTATYAGQGLGAEPDAPAPALEPALTYRVLLPEGLDDKAAMPRLKQLEEEEPLLRFVWDEQLREIHVQLMGEVQTELLRALLSERFGMEVGIDAGRIQYRETIAAPVEGCGHYEPLKHYAEVRVLLEPLEPGRGLIFESDCPTDALALNWQRLILTHLAEKRHLGVLTGAPLTDVRITLLAGRAHLKHTEGGDFRQATYRAVRQALMKAHSVLLEPCYAFRLAVPLSQTGRAITDLRQMHAEFSTETRAEETVLDGTAPVSTMRDYAAAVAAYTGGRGRLSCEMGGYRPCHNAEAVIAAAAYDPEADLDNTPDSVFCAHGAGTTVKWDRVDALCDLDARRAGDAPAAPRPRMQRLTIDEAELEAIMAREFGPIRRPMYTRAGLPGVQTPERAVRQKKETVVIDGYNVIFAWDELKALAADSLDTARTRLAEILVNYRGFTGSDVVLVFDGYAVKDNPGEKSGFHGIRVVYTKENESADIYIQKLAHDIGRNDTVRVVTSDRLIRLSALGSGIRRTSAREFGAEVDWVMSQIGDVLRRSAAAGHTTKLTESRL